MSRPSTEDRLGRLLAVVPWVASHDGPAVRDVCARFGVDEAELLDDLELLFLCGVHPFTPDTLIEVDVADGRVWIRYADYFRRPLRLTAPEGLALVCAGKTWLAVPGADPAGALARALAKLERALGLGPSVAVELAPVEAGVLAALREAAGTAHKVEIDYYSFGRDDRGVRVVQPWQVFNRDGEWYLRAWCERAGAERLFRVDRIQRAEPSDEGFETPGDLTEPPTWSPGPDAARWVLDLGPEAAWIAERYPTERVDRLADGRLRVTLRSDGPAWMERLLLRAGGAATVVEGDPSLGRHAAARLLRRYQPR